MIQKEIFKASFLDEPDAYQGISESEWLLFSVIERIIEEPETIAELEKEYCGTEFLQ